MQQLPTIPKHLLGLHLQLHNLKPMKLTNDFIYHYLGFHIPGGICRVRIYQRKGQVPIMLVSELDENRNTSITNMAEYLAAELLLRYFPDRLKERLPVLWIEHY